MVLPLLGALISGGIGLTAANRAARAQTNSANAQMTDARRREDRILGRLEPWYQGGQQANSALNYLAGFGEAPEGYRGFTGTPGYDFRMQAGRDALQGGAAARGDLFGGRTQRALMEYGQNLGTQEFGNHLNLLGSLSGQGQHAAAGGASAITKAGVQAGQAMGDRGNAQAAGFIGGANAFGDAIGNAVGSWQYQNALNGGQGAGWGLGNLFGGGQSGGSGYTGVRPMARPF